MNATSAPVDHQAISSGRPRDLTRIPDWVYTDKTIYEREVEKIFHGRTWNYVALEAEVPNPGDFIRSNVGPTPVVVSRAPTTARSTCSRTAARTAPPNSAAS